MKMYLAGNFIIMGNRKKEKKFKKKLGKDYFRLCSFFYHKNAKILLGINNEKK